MVKTDAAGDAGDARDALQRGEAIVAIVTPSQAGGAPQVYVDGAEIFAAQAALRGLAELRAGATGAASQGDIPTADTVTRARVSILFNRGLRTAVIMIPGLCGVILVFVGTIATALGVVRERQAGTMEQLAVMPFRPRDVFLGKIAPYLLIAAVDMVVVVAAGMLLFDVPFRGSVAVFSLGAALFLFVTLGLGVLISTVSQTQGQAIQLAIMTMLPQILLSGLVLPALLDGRRSALDRLPAAAHLLHQDRARRHGARRPVLGALAVLRVLAGMGLVVFTLSTLRFRRDLAPAGEGAASQQTSLTRGGGLVTVTRPSLTTPAGTTGAATR